MLNENDKKIKCGEEIVYNFIALINILQTLSKS